PTRPDSRERCVPVATGLGVGEPAAALEGSEDIGLDAGDRLPPLHAASASTAAAAARPTRGRRRLPTAGRPGPGKPATGMLEIVTGEPSFSRQRRARVAAGRPSR